MKNLISICAALALLVGTMSVHAAAPDNLTGLSETIRVGDQLFQALDEKKRKDVAPHFVALETEIKPYVRSGEFMHDGKSLKVVYVSAGFMDLIRNIAHAKAIDAVEPGYFQNYVSLLSEDKVGVPALPKGDDARFKTEEVLAQTQDFYGQMVGVVMGIELSHHYLGHYKKYSAKLVDQPGNPMPLNSLITKSEWDKSVDAGTDNSLNAGYSTEGVRALYEAIGKMTTRPPWTASFVPTTAKVDRLAQRLVKGEKKFFD
jgi:hypothetical protein